MYLPYLSFSLILICLVSADELNDPHDDYSQAVNNFEQSALSNATQNVADFLQTLNMNNSTGSQNQQNLTGLTNLTTANIPTLFNTYQYDSPAYPEVKPKDQSTSSSSSQSTLLESSGTNLYSKEYSGFDDNQKMYIEQQIEQDSKYLPEIFDLPPPVPAQVIEQSSSSSAQTDSSSSGGQVNVFDYGTKINKITRPVQAGTIRTTPVLANKNRLNKYSATKGNSIRMANNQEWNVIEKTQGGYINVAQPNYANENAALKSALNSYTASDDSFSSFDQQYDLTKLSNAAGQTNYNRPIEGTTQIITANNPQQASSYQYNPQHVQQQIISSSQYAISPVKQAQTVAQYNPIQQANTYVRKPPCSKSKNAYNNYNQQSDRQRPFYFGWKQQQQRLNNNAQKATVNQATNYVQQQPISYPIPSQANQNRYFGMPNQYDQQSFNKGRKCCIVRFVPKPALNKGQQQQSFAASSMPSFNPFQNNLTGMFGIGVNSVVNKIENKKRKVKKLIKAPFMFVNGMKQKAFSSANQFRAPAYPSRPNNNYSPSNYGPNYVQQQNTFGTKSVSPEYSY